MSDGKRSILFISSTDPLSGQGKIGMTHVEAFLEKGYFVDFITKYKVPGRPDIKYVLEKRAGKFSNFWFKIWKKIFKIRTADRFLFYKRENHPPVKIQKILNLIQKDYDILIIYFWQDLLSYRTVEAIYDKMEIKPKVVFLCADYSVMTGGCHFPGDCDNFKTGCGNCPMLGKYARSNDFTYKNVQDRKEIIAKIRPVVVSNSYMQSFLIESSVMKNGATLAYGSMILDLKIFKNLNPVNCKKDLGIFPDKFVIFFGCQNFNDKRKGMEFLLKAFDVLYKKLSNEERNKILLLIVGRHSDEIEKNLKFQFLHMGYVDVENLPRLYSSADVFVSPSINDAGPSMVNQSIACGTPVVAFEIGTALEVVKDTGAGYCVPLYDTNAMAESILKIYHQNSAQKESMRKTCREVAVRFHSYDAIVRSFENAIG